MRPPEAVRGAWDRVSFGALGQPSLPHLTLGFQPANGGAPSAVSSHAVWVTFQCSSSHGNKPPRFWKLSLVPPQHGSDSILTTQTVGSTASSSVQTTRQHTSAVRTDRLELSSPVCQRQPTVHPSVSWRCPVASFPSAKSLRHLTKTGRNRPTRTDAQPETGEW